MVCDRTLFTTQYSLSTCVMWKSDASGAHTKRCVLQFNWKKKEMKNI